jgi:hypothetical protein
LLVIPEGDLLLFLQLFSPISHKRTGAPSMSQFHRDMDGKECYSAQQLLPFQFCRSPKGKPIFCIFNLFNQTDTKQTASLTTEPPFTFMQQIPTACV